MRKTLHYILAAIMILGALGHILAPEVYAPAIPDFIPDQLAHILSVIFEAGTGILLLIPRLRYLGGLAFMLLMIGFLPIHIYDVFRPDPFTGSTLIAFIRLFLQFLLIYLGLMAYRQNK